MDGTRERRPCVGLQQHTPRRLGHRAHPHGGVKSPPRQHAGERQTPLQALSPLPLTRCQATTALHNPMPDLNAPSTSVPLDALHGVVDRLDGHGGQQQPLDGLDLGWWLDCTDLHGPQRHGRQALSLAVPRWTPGQGTRVQRQRGRASRLCPTPRHLHDDRGDDGWGRDSGPPRARRRADTAIPRGAPQQIDAGRAPSRQHGGVDLGFPIAHAHQTGGGTAVTRRADGVETVAPLLTFLLA